MQTFIVIHNQEDHSQYMDRETTLSKGQRIEALCMSDAVSFYRKQHNLDNSVRITVYDDKYKIGHYF